MAWLSTEIASGTKFKQINIMAMIYYIHKQKQLIISPTVYHIKLQLKYRYDSKIINTKKNTHKNGRKMIVASIIKDKKAWLTPR